jgi:hypothetical protein
VTTLPADVDELARLVADTAFLLRRELILRTSRLERMSVDFQLFSWEASEIELYSCLHIIAARVSHWTGRPPGDLLGFFMSTVEDLARLVYARGQLPDSSGDLDDYREVLKLRTIRASITQVDLRSIRGRLVASAMAADAWVGGTKAGVQFLADLALEKIPADEPSSRLLRRLREAHK